MRWLEEFVAAAQGNLGELATEALYLRGVTDEQIELYRIGYLEGLPKGLELPQEFVAWSLSGRKLRNVLVLPMTTALGQIKGVQFRHVDRKVGGYTDFYAAKDEPAYFGFSQAMPHIWATQKVCLVEGAFDLLPVQRAIPFVVSTMTSSVSSTFLRFLRRNVREIWFGYDMDLAGRRGATDFAKEHGEEFERVRIPNFPKIKYVDGKRAKDPSDLWEVLGDAQLGVVLRTAFGQG